MYLPDYNLPMKITKIYIEFSLQYNLTVLTGKTVLLNSAQEFIETEAWLLKLGCFCPFYYLYAINFFYILLSHIIECRCLKNVIRRFFVFM